MPVVQCPWDCCDYVHRVGTLPFDSILRSFFPDAQIPLTARGKAKLELCESARRDFFRDQYDRHLNNPDWTVFPSVAVLPREGLAFLTCDDHDGGTRDRYFFPPRAPSPSAPPLYSDQVAHAVLQPRTVKAMKPRTFNTGYQVCEQQGSFAGIDTCCIRSYGNLTFQSCLLADCEALAYSGRPDIRGLVGQMVSKKLMLKEQGANMKELAESRYPQGSPCIEALASSGTYMPYGDCIKAQQDLSQVFEITVLDNIPTGTQGHRIFTPMWPRFLLRVHPNDSYGERFHSLFGGIVVEDCRLVWILSAAAVCVPALYELLATSVTMSTDWAGYFLAFLSGKVLHGAARTRPDRSDMFAAARRWNITRLRDEIAKHLVGVPAAVESGDYQAQWVKTLLADILPPAKCSFLDHRVGSLENNIRLLIAPERELIVVTRPVTAIRSGSTRLPHRVFSNGIEFELRLIGISGHTAYARHGGHMTHWWMLAEASGCDPPKRVLSHAADGLPVCGTWDLAIYVNVEPTSGVQLRDQYLSYIGGQTMAKCSVHSYPLVVCAPREGTELCCGLPSADGHQSGVCGCAVRYRCPCDGCRAYLCRKCFKNIDARHGVCVVPSSADAPARAAARGQEPEPDEEGDDDDGPDHNGPGDPGDATDAPDDGIAMERVEDDDIDSLPDDRESDDEDVEPALDLHTGTDPVFDCELFQDGENAGAEDQLPQSIATREVPATIRADPKSDFISNTALLNGVTSLLVRRQHVTETSRRTKEFLHSMVATVSGSSVPLVYPEWMLFPRIFWKAAGDGRSAVGALPACFLSQTRNHRKHGVASVHDHVRARSKSISSFTSTDPGYQIMCHDYRMHAMLGSQDTRLVMNRGCIPTEGCGLRLNNKDDTFFTDSIDNRSNVNKLTAAQRFYPAHIFLTLTCNQSKHPGLAKVKAHLDSRAGARAHPGYHSMNVAQQAEVEKAMYNSAASLLLRNWMEARKMLMEYIAKSPEMPLGAKVLSMFWRDEYQDEEGNLPHVHALITLDIDRNDRVAIDHVRDLIRGFVRDIVRVQEIDGLVMEGLLRDNDDWFDAMEQAQMVLTHRTRRNQKRTGTGDKDVAPRERNNFYQSPDPTSSVMCEVDPKHTAHAREILAKLGLCEPGDGTFTPKHPLLRSQRALPPVRREDGNMSPVVARLFLATRSMLNAQYCTGYSVTRYVTKYITKMDKCARVTLNVNPGDATDVRKDAQFLYNTKIGASAHNEEKRAQQQRSKGHPHARHISRFEIVQLNVGYPQVSTDLVFANIPSVPLEQRCGMQRRSDKDAREQDDVADLAAYRQLCSNDRVLFVIAPDKVRRDMYLAAWRQFTAHQLVLINDYFHSKVTIDKVTLFGMRPPELRGLFSRVADFYRWFQRDPNPAEDGDELERLLSPVLEDSAWIDGQGHRWRLRCNALGEVDDYLRGFRLRPHPWPQGVLDMHRFVSSIVGYYKAAGFTRRPSVLVRGLAMRAQILSPVQQGQWNTWQDNLIIFSDSDRLLPVPVFSNIRPSNPSRYLLHMLISMGEFETETQLVTHHRVRDAFVEARLIAADPSCLEDSIVALVRRWVLEQLCFYPIATRMFDRYLVEAYETLRSVLIDNSIPIFDAPACLYTRLLADVETSVHQRMTKYREDAIRAAYTELSAALPPGSSDLPPMTDFMDGSAVWDGSLTKSDVQTQDSYDEQLQTRGIIWRVFEEYRDVSRTVQAKSLLIAGGPGCGKTHCMMWGVLRLILNGFVVLPATMLADRANAIGGTHFHRLLCAPTKRNLTPQRFAELSVLKIMKDPVTQHLIKRIDFLVFDEFGQLSAGLLSAMEIIFRRVRENHEFMGGSALIGTIDDRQIRPIDGRPVLLSPHMWTSFRVVTLKHSVRAFACKYLREINRIVRLSWSELEANPMEEETFINIISEKCRFVENWDSPEIDRGTFRAFARVMPALAAKAQFIDKTKRDLCARDYVERRAEDLELALESHQDWVPAKPRTAQALAKGVKEADVLLFFVGAVYQFTYNDPRNRFTQSRLAYLSELPSRGAVKNFHPVDIWAAPSGCKAIPSGTPLPTNEQLLASGWAKIRIGTAPEFPQTLPSLRVRAKRRQYGLRHHVSSTIHSCQGATLQTLATQISLHDDYRLWEKGQGVVLISRTQGIEGLIFVGDKSQTLAALRHMLRLRAQFDDYMDHVLRVLAGEESTVPVIELHEKDIYPFRPRDMPLPRDLTGFSYMLVSSRDWRTIYIGETNNLDKRLKQHNSGVGAKQTEPLRLRPWALVACVSGFQSDKNAMRSFQNDWQARSRRMMDLGTRSVSTAVDAGIALVSENRNGSGPLSRSHVELVFVQHADLRSEGCATLLVH
jgi:predicted GIY-YIG superfamily endonuclease